MANRKVKPENKKIPLHVTVKTFLIKKAKAKAERQDISFSQYIENILMNDLGE